MWEKLDFIKLCGIKRCKNIYIFSMCCAGTSLILSGWYQFSAITWNSKLRGTGNVMRVTRFSNMARAGTWLLAVHSSDSSWRLHVNKLAAARDQDGGSTWTSWRLHVTKMAAAREQVGGCTWPRWRPHVTRTAGIPPWYDGRSAAAGQPSTHFSPKTVNLVAKRSLYFKGTVSRIFLRPTNNFQETKEFFPVLF